MTRRPPFGPTNRDQRVADRECAICGGAVFRASRGPAPRWCPSCDINLRRRRQLRAYLQAAARIADELSIAKVAELTRQAVASLDDERTSE